jgi:hypothetical protein
MTLQVTASYSVWGVFQEYRAIGRGRPLIKTRQQHKDYLRINGYEEVGNDKSMAHRTCTPLNLSGTSRKQVSARKLNAITVKLRRSDDK